MRLKWLALPLVFSVFRSTLQAPEVKLQSMPEYVNFLEKFKKLQGFKTKDEMKSITTLGLVAGSLQVQKSMRDNLTQMVNNLLDEMNMAYPKKSLQKISEIEMAVQRDKRAIIILGNALDVARGDVSLDLFRSKVKRMLREYEAERRTPVYKNSEKSVGDRLEKLKESLSSQVNMMKEMLKEKSVATLQYLGEKHGISASDIKNNITEASNASQAEFIPTFLEPIEDNIIEDVRRQDGIEAKMPQNGTSPETLNGSPEIKKDDDEGFTPEFSLEVTVGSNDGSAAPPGGLLVGLLSGLSGGEGGSDVAALVGALTGVVMNLFGPGGLDIPSLLSGGSALLAGLLSGDRNFGTVLGEYVGLTIDGFSGGGGAINNGRFFGNLIGTILAELSADPEDDDLPPKPMIFIQNFLSSLSKAKDKNMSESLEGQRNSLFGFITHLVQGIIGGITSFILNASSSSSAGSSKGTSANHRWR